MGRVTEADGTLPGPVKVRSLEAEASPITRAEVSWVRPEKGGIETEGEVDTDTSSRLRAALLGAVDTGARDVVLAVQ